MLNRGPVRQPGLLERSLRPRDRAAVAQRWANRGNYQPTAQDVLDAVAMGTMAVPVAGDVAGLGADIHRFVTEPKSRTWGNYGLAAAGMVPFLPGMAMTSRHITGPKLSRELYEKSQVTGREARRLKGEALEARKAIRETQEARQHQRWAAPPDLLVDGGPHQLKRKLRHQREINALRFEEESRNSLVQAAREARKMGAEVRASKDRSGRISSYYIRMEDGHSLRISDHEIPSTPQREFMAMAHGRDFYTGYHGNELIIDRPMTTEEIRAALRSKLFGEE